MAHPRPVKDCGINRYNAAITKVLVPGRKYHQRRFRGDRAEQSQSFSQYSLWGCLRMTIEYVKIRNFTALAGVHDFSNFSFRAS